MGLLFKLAWRNLWRNKRRSLITISSVLFAVFFAVLMRSIQRGSYDLMIENVVGSFTGYAQIQNPEYQDEPTLEHAMFPSQDDFTALQNAEGIERVIPRVQQFGLFSFQNRTRGGLVVGIEAEKEIPGLNVNQRLSDGRTFSGPTAIEIILAEGLAEVLKVNVGDSIVLISQGYRGQSAYGLYPVVGTVRLSSPELNRSMAFLPLEEARYLVGAPEITTHLVIQPEESSSDQIATSIQNLELNDSTMSVYTWEELMPELVQTIEADSAGGVIMIFILYLVISFGLFGTVLMMTAERQREFGVLVALGMKRQRLAMVSILESVLLTLLGALGGVTLAMPIVWNYHLNPIQLSGQMAETMLSYGMEPLLPTSVDPMISLSNGLVVVAISLVCSLYPLVKINKLQPVKAMQRS